MSVPKKKKNLKKQVRQVEDELGVDSDTEDMVDKIIDLFDGDDDDDDEDSSDSIFGGDSDDSDDNGDFGGGDSGGGGSSDDW